MEMNHLRNKSWLHSEMNQLKLVIFGWRQHHGSAGAQINAHEWPRAPRPSRAPSQNGTGTAAGSLQCPAANQPWRTARYRHYFTEQIYGKERLKGEWLLTVHGYVHGYGNG